jgi:hypothetical protein
MLLRCREKVTKEIDTIQIEVEEVIDKAEEVGLEVVTTRTRTNKINITTTNSSSVVDPRSTAR